jgi:hypothetical protein
LGTDTKCWKRVLERLVDSNTSGFGMAGGATGSMSKRLGLWRRVSLGAGSKRLLRPTGRRDGSRLISGEVLLGRGVDEVEDTTSERVWVEIISG